MKTFNTIIIVSVISFFAFSSQARVSCSEVFKELDEMGLQRQNLDEMMTEFETIKVDLKDSKTQHELNVNIHGLTVMANKIMDTAMDFIIQVNFMKLDADVQATKKDWAMKLVEELQRTFEIGDNAIGAAINNRLTIEGAEHQAKMEAQSERRAIGFGRDQSSSDFNKDAIDRVPAGFRPDLAKESESTEVAETVPLGFIPAQRSGVEKSVREIVEYAEPKSKEDTIPFGYKKQSAENESSAPTVRNPIGFRTRSEVDTIEYSRTHGIIFNLDTGTFDFIKGIY